MEQERQKASFAGVRCGFDSETALIEREVKSYRYNVLSESFMGSSLVSSYYKFV